jgi:hypothetical protein
MTLHKCCYRSSGELLSKAFEASRLIDVSSGAVASACHLCTPREGLLAVRASP